MRHNKSQLFLATLKQRKISKLMVLFVGICPQHDVLFDRLTVEEHLWFFAKLKGCPSGRIRGEVDRMIQSVGLADKRHVQTRYLSGGMKRKLSVGIALVGDSKVRCKHPQWIILCWCWGKLQ